MLPINFPVFYQVQLIPLDLQKSPDTQPKLILIEDTGLIGQLEYMFTAEGFYPDLLIAEMMANLDNGKHVLVDSPHFVSGFQGAIISSAHITYN